MFALIKTELALVWSLFRQDAGHNRKRMASSTGQCNDSA